MDSQFRRAFGLAFLFALVFGTISAERAFAQVMSLVAENCPTGNTITVDTNTPLTTDIAERLARDADPDATEHPRIMQELLNCATQKPGSTLQFADGTYEDVGEIKLGEFVHRDGDDPDTEDVTEKATFRGTPANREAVKFTGEMSFVVEGNNISVEYITLGFVLCGGVACYFDNPYSAVTTGYRSNAVFAGAGGEDSKADISMKNVYGESGISEDDLKELPRGFPIGAVYASIGALADRVDLSGNCLTANPKVVHRHWQ